jgi:hypothetical protein
MGKPQKSVSFVPDYTSAGCLFYDYLPHSGFVQQFAQRGRAKAPLRSAFARRLAQTFGMVISRKWFGITGNCKEEKMTTTDNMFIETLRSRAKITSDFLIRAGNFI